MPAPVIDGKDDMIPAHPPQGALTGVILAPSAYAPLEAALRSHGMPVEGLRAANKQYFAFYDGRARLVGYGGLELHRPDALLRSILVTDQRCGGLGREIVAWMVHHAGRHGVRHMYLLTRRAGGFFARLGFTPLARDDCPAAIRASGQFNDPDLVGADCLMLTITAPMMAHPAPVATGLATARAG